MALNHVHISLNAILDARDCYVEVLELSLRSTLLHLHPKLGNFLVNLPLPISLLMNKVLYPLLVFVKVYAKLVQETLLQMFHV